MVFWLFCQQAGAAAATIAMAFPAQNEFGSIVKTDVACHDHNVAENISDNAVMTSLQSHSDVAEKNESSATSSQSCCDVSCQCCMSGCHSMLSSESNQNIIATSPQPDDNYLSLVPQIPFNSVFRPPIIA